MQNLNVHLNFVKWIFLLNYLLLHTLLRGSLTKCHCDDSSYKYILFICAILKIRMINIIMLSYSARSQRQAWYVLVTLLVVYVSK